MLFHIVTVTLRSWQEKPFYLTKADLHGPIVQELAQQMRRREDGIRAVIRTIQVKDEYDFWFTCGLKGWNMQPPPHYALSYRLGKQKFFDDLEDFELTLDDSDPDPGLDDAEFELTFEELDPVPPVPDGLDEADLELDLLSKAVFDDLDDEGFELTLNDPYFSHDLGNSYYYHDLNAPLADVSKPIRTDTKDAFAHCIWAEAYLCMNDFRRAVAECNKAIRLDPKNASAYGIRGCAFRQKGNFVIAIADFTEALRLSPNYEWCKNQLEMARRKQRQN